MLSALWDIVIGFIGLIIMIPLYILSVIVQFISFGIIDKETAGKWIVILFVIYVIYFIIKCIFEKIQYIKKMNNMKVSKKYNKSFNVKNIGVEEFVGTVSERKVYVKSQLDRINKILNDNPDFVFENNKLVYKPFLNRENTFLKVNRSKIEFLNNHLPVKYEDISKLTRKYETLIRYIESDLGESFKQFSIFNKGVIGEQSVEKELALYGNRYKVLRNIRVELNGQSSESDMIIVCENGVFVVETKNYGKKGQTIHIKQDGLWTLNGKPLKDVNSQNNYHCAINQTIINNALKEKGFKNPFIDCNSIICIANNDVLIQNESNQIVVRASNVVTEIKSSKPKYILSEKLQQEIIKIMLENNLPEKLYSIEGRAERIERNMKELKDVISYIEDMYSIIDQL